MDFAHGGRPALWPESSWPSCRERCASCFQRRSAVLRAAARDRACHSQCDRGGALCGSSAERRMRGLGGRTQVAAFDVISLTGTGWLRVVCESAKCRALCLGRSAVCCGTRSQADDRDSSHPALPLGLLALAGYGWYASRRSVGRYALVVALFAVGLAAKPMIVTLPILLFLWDYWPLQRAAYRKEIAAGRPTLLQLIVEKIPLFALSAASSWITLYAQRSGGALGNVELLPLGQRVGNAIYSYAAYLGKGIWPAGLAVFYPHPEGSLAAWKVLAAALLIVIITALAWVYREQHRYLLMGWLWYLVAMIPMIGVVQVGRQAMADRYAYLPFVGLFIAAVWGCSELFERMKLSTFAQRTVAAAALLAYASTAFLQINYWHNSYTLFSHALAVTRHNGID